MSNQDRNQKRQKRRIRVRKKISGTAERPRLSIVRSLKHISAQVIDDVKGHTIVAASSLSKDLRGDLKSGGNRTAARAVGKKVAELAKAAGVEHVVFDRGGYVYHGRVKELAEGAREGGLKF